MVHALKTQMVSCFDLQHLHEAIYSRKKQTRKTLTDSSVYHQEINIQPNGNLSQRYLLSFYPMFDSDRLPALSIIASPNHQTIPLFHPQMFSSFFLSLTCLLHTEKSRPWPIQATADPNRNSFCMKSKGWILGFDFVTMTLTLFLHTGFCVEWTPATRLSSLYKPIYHLCFL